MLVAGGKAEGGLGVAFWALLLDGSFMVVVEEGDGEAPERRGSGWF
jgi:hypothetical protein